MAGRPGVPKNRPMKYRGAQLADAEWMARACAAVSKFAALHPADATRLAEDLRRAWPALGPEEAVSYFFRPLKPGRDVVELS